MEDEKDVQEEGASQATDETPPRDLLAEVQRLFDEHGKDRNRVAEALNELGIPTPRGKFWNYANLSHYMAKHTPDLLPKKEKETKKTKATGSKGKGKKKQKVEEKPVETVKTEEPAPKKAPPGETPPPPSEPDPLRAYVKLPDQPVPFIDGKTKSGSFKALEDLYRLAEEKAKKDKVRTGGSMSSLVQVLLWAYVNGPKEFLVPLYNEESAGTETVRGGRPKKS